MTQQDAAQYIPLVEALKDGELQKYIETKSGEFVWMDIHDADFTSTPDLYRRRPKPRVAREFWLHQCSASVRMEVWTNEVTFRHHCNRCLDGKSVFVREVLPDQP